MRLSNSVGEKYQLLQAMGIPHWIERSPSSLHADVSPRSHPRLVSDHPIFCAACLVILPAPWSSLEGEQQTMLMAMLKVLDLKMDQLGIAAVSDPQLFQLEGSDLLRTEIQKWAPRTVLILGKDYEDLSLGSIPLYFTHHPSKLQAAPALKRETYETLLSLKKNLKENLHHDNTIQITGGK